MVEDLKLVRTGQNKVAPSLIWWEKPAVVGYCASPSPKWTDAVRPPLKSRESNSNPFSFIWSERWTSKHIQRRNTDLWRDTHCADGHASWSWWWRTDGAQTENGCCASPQMNDGRTETRAPIWYLIVFCAVWVTYKYLYTLLQESRGANTLKQEKLNEIWSAGFTIRAGIKTGSASIFIKSNQKNFLDIKLKDFLFGCSWH